MRAAALNYGNRRTVCCVSWACHAPVRLLWEVNIQRINVLGARIAQIHARTVRSVVTPRSKISEIDVQVLEAEHHLRAALPNSELLALVIRVIPYRAAVRTPRWIGD